MQDAYDAATLCEVYMKHWNLTGTSGAYYDDSVEPGQHGVAMELTDICTADAIAHMRDMWRLWLVFRPHIDARLEITQI